MVRRHCRHRNLMVRRLWSSEINLIIILVPAAGIEPAASCFVGVNTAFILLHAQYLHWEKTFGNGVQKLGTMYPIFGNGYNVPHRR